VARLATDLSALVCGASAGVHGALVAPHATESAELAVAFAMAALALAVAAVGLALVPTPATTSLAAGLLLAVASAYLLSRTTGLPGLTEHSEPFDVLGTLVSVAEAGVAIVAVTAVLAVPQPNRRSHR